MPHVGKIVLRIGVVLRSIAVVTFTGAFLVMLIPLALLYQMNYGNRFQAFSGLYNGYRNIFVLGVTGEHNAADFGPESELDGQNAIEQSIFIVVFIFVCLFSINMLIAVVTDKWSESGKRKLWVHTTNDRLRMQVTLGLLGRQLNWNSNFLLKFSKYIVQNLMSLFGKCCFHEQNQMNVRGTRTNSISGSSDLRRMASMSILRSDKK